MDVVDDDPATPEEHHTRVTLMPVRLGRRGRWDERQLSHQPDPELPRFTEWSPRRSGRGTLES
jgi:hypothetical protein